MVRDSTSSYKIDYVIVMKTYLNSEGHQNPISGAKVTAILPIGGASAVEGLRSTGLPRLVFYIHIIKNKLSQRVGAGLLENFFFLYFEPK